MISTVFTVKMPMRALSTKHEICKGVNKCLKKEIKATPKFTHGLIEEDYCKDTVKL